MSDVVTRTIRLPESSASAVDAAVLSGQFKSIDHLVQVAVSELLDPAPILDGDELDRLLDEAECPRGAYVDGPTFMNALAAKWGLVARG